MPDLAGRKAALVQALNDAHQALLGVLAGIDEQGWNTQTGTHDRWTVRQTVSHLATGEAGNLVIAKAVASGQDLYREDFDLARYNKRQIEKNQERTGPDNLTMLEAARQETLAFLDSLDAETLDRAGRRTTGEPTTVEGVFQRIVSHQQEHTDEIRQALQQPA